jgi:hypothetical protein
MCNVHRLQFEKDEGKEGLMEGGGGTPSIPSRASFWSDIKDDLTVLLPRQLHITTHFHEVWFLKTQKIFKNKLKPTNSNQTAENHRFQAAIKKDVYCYPLSD